MCLDVTKSYVRNPIAEMECGKILQYNGKGVWVTPYREVVVPVGNGWFMPMKPAKRRVREYSRYEIIEGGYIHAFDHKRWSANTKQHVSFPKRLKVGTWYTFAAIARDVVATGDWHDIVCRALYIPAFDKTGEHRNAILDI